MTDSEGLEATYARRSHGDASVPRMVDVPRAERAVIELLEAFGYDTTVAPYDHTPARVAQALQELTGGHPEPMSVHPNESGASGPVMVRDIAFISLCEHHLLPFQGAVRIAYLPRDVIGGFSGFAQAVEMYAHDLGLQETLTVNVANYLMRELNPYAVSVTIEAQHMCMAARGVRARESRIVTREVLGERASDPGFLAFLAMSAEPAE